MVLRCGVQRGQQIVFRPALKHFGHEKPARQRDLEAERRQRAAVRADAEERDMAE